MDNMRVSALTTTSTHLICGTLDGLLYEWPLKQIKEEISKPVDMQDNDETNDI